MSDRPARRSTVPPKATIGVLKNTGQMWHHARHALSSRGHSIIEIDAHKIQPSSITALFKTCQAFMLLGRDPNIHPSYWNEEVHPKATGVFDKPRDELSLRIVAESVVRAIPVFGICGGLQEIQVALGGALHQHLPSLFNEKHDIHENKRNVEQNEWAELVHHVDVVPGGMFESLYGKMRNFRVNSVHEQGVVSAAQLAPDLQAELICPDTGVVEGFTHKFLPIMATQFHPELKMPGQKHEGYDELLSAFSRAADKFARRDAEDALSPRIPGPRSNSVTEELRALV